MGLGSLPIRLGGGPSREGRIYGDLRASLGTAAPPAGDIEDLLLIARARVVAGVESEAEAAIIEAEPATASRMLPRYEELAGLGRTSAGQPLEERRARAAARWYATNEMTPTALQEVLTELDSRFVLESPTALLTCTPSAAAAFGDSDEPGWSRDAQAPFWSHNHFVVARLNVGHTGALSDADRAILLETRDFLRTALPSVVRCSVHAGPLVWDEGLWDERSWS